VAQKSLSSFLNCMISYIIIFFYSIVITKKISISWVMVPVILLLLFLSGFGLAMFFAVANVYFQDTVQIVNVALMIWMWMTPIVYVKTILPRQLTGMIEQNPIYPFIDSLQQIIVRGQMPQIRQLLQMAVCAIVSVSIGYLVTKRNLSQIRDMI